jgi:endonuclease/exonuclease/phosphatase family metal-dependent hydrolase
MAIDRRIRERTSEWISAGMMVLALGGGWFMVEEDFAEAPLDFVEVGWWNIRDLSNSSRNDTEIRQIASVIDGPEVMAIGELNDPDALDRITQELGPSWAWAATTDKVGHSSHTAEYYGFIWNADVVEMVDSIRVDPDPGDLLDREPAWATFRTLQGGLDFTVIATHVTWGSHVGPRKEEVKRMKDVWLRTQQATVGDEDLILVGDFNRNKTDDSFDSLLTVPGVLRANEDTGPTHVHSSTTYDQIFLSTDFTREWTGEFETSEFDEIFFDNDDDAARLAVSDHRPVWITLFVPEEDDD